MNAAKLGLDNLGGVFVILAGGLVLSLVMALVEFLINALINSKTDKVTLILVYFNVFYSCISIVRRRVEEREFALDRALPWAHIIRCICIVGRRVEECELGPGTTWASMIRVCATSDTPIRLMYWYKSGLFFTLRIAI